MEVKRIYIGVVMDAYTNTLQQLYNKYKSSSFPGIISSDTSFVHSQSALLNSTPDVEFIPVNKEFESDKDVIFEEKHSNINITSSSSP